MRTFLFFILLTALTFAQRNVGRATIDSLNTRIDSIITNASASVQSKYYLSSYASLSAAVTAIGSRDAILVIDDTTSSYVSIPENITVQCDNGAYFTDSVKIAGSFESSLRKRFASGVDFSTAKVDKVYPEWFGTDADTAILRAINSQAKRIEFTQNYSLSEQLSVNLNNRDLQLNGNGYSELTSTATIDTNLYWAFWTNRLYPSDEDIYSNNGSQFQVIVDAENQSEYVITKRISGTNAPSATGTLTKVSGLGSATYTYTEVLDGQYYIPTGVIEIRNGGKVEISNLSVRSTVMDATNYNYLDGLLLYDNDQNILSNVTSKKGNYSGIRVQRANSTDLINCTADSNKYAGAIIIASKHTNVIGGSYSYNGTHFITDGYGLTFSHQYGTSTNNEDISVIGIKANYNYRKGIDIHGGVNAVIQGNFITGFGYGGIYAVGEGANELYHLKNVRDVLISTNIVKNDSAWYNALYTTGFNHPIQVGSYDSVVYAGGSFRIENNVVKDIDNDGLRAPISIFAGTGLQVSEISVKNNYIESNLVYTGQGLLYLNGTVSDPLLVDIQGNTFKGSADYAVNIESGEVVRLKNTFNGTFDKAYYIFNTPLIVADGDVLNGDFGTVLKTESGDSSNVVKFENLTIKGTIDTLFQVANGIPTFFSGTYNTNPLPRQIGEYQGTTERGYSTSATYPDTLDLIYVDTDIYSTGSAMMDVEVQVTAHDNAFNGVYYYGANAADSLTTAKFSTSLNRVSVTNGNDTTFQPTLLWTGSGDARTLSLICTQPYTAYFIKIKHSGWRLKPRYKL